jgi:glycerol uptake facilitator-like aquaporin
VASAEARRTARERAHHVHAQFVDAGYRGRPNSRRHVRLLVDGNVRKSGHLGLPGLDPDVSIIDAVIMDVLMTFFLVLVIFGTVVEHRSPEAMAPLAIGLTITMDILGAALPGRQ